jgi:hypothetical protein
MGGGLGWLETVLAQGFLDAHCVGDSEELVDRECLPQVSGGLDAS